MTLIGSAVVSWPHKARAQQPAMPVVGFLSGRSPYESGTVEKIYASFQQFRASIMDWSDIAERAFLNSRRLA